MSKIDILDNQANHEMQPMKTAYTNFENSQQYRQQPDGAQLTSSFHQKGENANSKEEKRSQLKLGSVFRSPRDTSGNLKSKLSFKHSSKPTSTRNDNLSKH